MDDGRDKIVCGFYRGVDALSKPFDQSVVLPCLCGHKARVTRISVRDYRVVCDNDRWIGNGTLRASCFAGPIALTPEEAAALWNEGVAKCR